MEPSSPTRRLRRTTRRAVTTWSSWKEPAYRRLSRTYDLPEGIDRVYCHHLRKTGGTSLHFSFLALGGEDPGLVQQRIERSKLHRTISGPYAFVAHRRRLLNEGHYFYGWSHLPAWTLSLPPATFTITILRDPLDRVVSHYRYLLEGDVPGMAFAVKDDERTLSAGGFSAYLQHVPREQLHGQLYKFSRTFDVTEARDRIARCSWVMFTEAYDEGLAGLSRKLSVPLVARRERVTRVEVPISDDDRERLQQMLEPEYELLRQVRQVRAEN